MNLDYYNACDESAAVTVVVSELNVNGLAKKETIPLARKCAGNSCCEKPLIRMIRKDG